MQQQIEAVQRMQDYIEAHLSERLTIAAIARASLFSPWYARRLFVEMTGVTPADYIRKLRLRKAALRLRDGRKSEKILDVALDLGFGSVDGCQRAFKREFGCNPKEYALSPIPIWLFTPYFIMDEERKKRKMSNYIIEGGRRVE